MVDTRQCVIRAVITTVFLSLVMWWRSVWHTRCVRNGPCWLMKCAVWRTGPTVPYTPWWRTSTPTTLCKKWLTWPSQHSARSSCTRSKFNLTRLPFFAYAFIFAVFPSCFLVLSLQLLFYSACSALKYGCLLVCLCLDPASYWNPAEVHVREAHSGQAGEVLHEEWSRPWSTLCSAQRHHVNPSSCCIEESVSTPSFKLLVWDHL